MTKFKPLTTAQTLGWYFASLVYGLGVTAAVGFGEILAPTGLFDAGFLPITVAVLGVVWVVGVVGMRLYIQDKNPYDPWDLLGIKRSK